MTLTNLFAFAGVAFAMVITPGPNMAYLISRSLWPPVLLHWITVVAWIILLGGQQLIVKEAP